MFPSWPLIVQAPWRNCFSGNRVSSTLVRAHVAAEELLADHFENRLDKGVGRTIAQGDEGGIVAEVVEEVVQDVRELLGVDQFVLECVEQ